MRVAFSPLLTHSGPSACSHFLSPCSIFLLHPALPPLSSPCPLVDALLLLSSGDAERRERSPSEACELMSGLAWPRPMSSLADWWSSSAWCARWPDDAKCSNLLAADVGSRTHASNRRLAHRSIIRQQVKTSESITSIIGGSTRSGDARERPLPATSMVMVLLLLLLLLLQVWPAFLHELLVTPVLLLAVVVAPIAVMAVVPVVMMVRVSMVTRGAVVVAVVMVAMVMA
jgi:hypothetical protein